jgi:hypothetical protein
LNHNSKKLIKLSLARKQGRCHGHGKKGNKTHNSQDESKDDDETLTIPSPGPKIAQ